MKARNFEDDIPSISVDNSRNHYVVVFDLTSMQDATKNFPYPELIAEPLKLELKSIYPPEHVTELNVLRERMSLVEVDKFGVVGRNYWNG